MSSAVYGVLALALYGLLGALGLWLAGEQRPARAWRWFKGTKHPWVWRRVLQRPDAPPYMIRYQLLVTRWLVVYINVILTPDHDTRLHNHPWRRCYSLKLRGGYWEELDAAGFARDGLGEIGTGWTAEKGFVLIHHPRRWSRIPERHRIVELIDGRPATTLFVALGNPRPWGFVNDDGSVTDGPSADGRRP